MNHYTLTFIVSSILLSCFVTLLMFSAVTKLYKTNVKKYLLVFGILLVSSTLWAIQFLNLLSFSELPKATYDLSYIALSWLSALVFASIVLHASSQKALQDITPSSLVDTLTQLPNIKALMHHLVIASERTKRSHTKYAVAYINIDNFKLINEKVGSQVSDATLQNIAKKLISAVRGCDIVARIGSDEFIAIIEEIECDEDCVVVIERMLNSVRAVRIINHPNVNLSVSIGIAMHPMDGDPEQLISVAKNAMLAAKENGKDQFRFFDAKTELTSNQLLEIYHGLKIALSNDELHLEYQIKIDSITREPVGAEALLRWHHPTKGVLYPIDFMGVADRFGLSGAISDWIIEECCRTLHQLNYLRVPFDISINLTHYQLKNTHFVSDVTYMLKRFDLPTSSLIFDLTEPVTLNNQPQFNTQLIQFKKAGLRVAIDDFGAISTNISKLRDWQINELKLAPSFTANIADNHKTRGIIQAVIELAHVLDLNVIAEGVETEDQRKVLTDLGCDQMQGYLISRPMPEDRLINLLKNLSLPFEDHQQFSIKTLQNFN